MYRVIPGLWIQLVYEIVFRMGFIDLFLRQGRGGYGNHRALEVANDSGHASR